MRRQVAFVGGSRLEAAKPLFGALVGRDPAPV
jgi:hypothetical protein